MPVLELALFGLLALGLILAAWSLLGHRRGRAHWRRARVLATLGLLGGSALVAAAHQAEMLIYLGLAAGGFVAAMLWESCRAPGFLDEP